jgi:uncharacterized membrane protein YbaN (DUF454 family)
MATVVLSILGQSRKSVPIVGTRIGELMLVLAAVGFDVEVVPEEIVMIVETICWELKGIKNGAWLSQTPKLRNDKRSLRLGLQRKRGEETFSLLIHGFVFGC